MTTDTISQIDDLPKLLSALQQGVRPEYLFFWGHKPDPEGGITKTCLSQWWRAPFTLEGITYPTAEHYMMAEKARIFGDEEIAQKILDTFFPRKAKSLGRLVSNYDDAIWEEQRFDIVVRGNYAKFGQNDELKRFLLATTGKVLVEASPQDRIWGIGLSEQDKRAHDPHKWKGLNLLGFALMQVRTRLVQEQA